MTGASEAELNVLHDPWMDERNVQHAISQGMYFAWHG